MSEKGPNNKGINHKEQAALDERANQQVKEALEKFENLSRKQLWEIILDDDAPILEKTAAKKLIDKIEKDSKS